jgi:hypothetical protein
LWLFTVVGVAVLSLALRWWIRGSPGSIAGRVLDALPGRAPVRVSDEFLAQVRLGSRDELRSVLDGDDRFVTWQRGEHLFIRRGNPDGDVAFRRDDPAGDVRMRLEPSQKAADEA